MKRLLTTLRCTFAACLIGMSLWALLLPPSFPHSSHALVNTYSVEIRAEESGTIEYRDVTRESVVEAGTQVATVTRETGKLERDLKEQNFAKIKLEEQIGKLDQITGELEEKRQGIEKMLETERSTYRDRLQKAQLAATENIRSLRETLSEKRSNESRVEPLFRDGIVNAAQWSQTRQLTLEAERQVRSAETEQSKLGLQLEPSRDDAESDGDQHDEIRNLVSRIDGVEQSISSMQLQRNTLGTELEELIGQIELAEVQRQDDRSYALTTPVEGLIWHRYSVDGQSVGEHQTVVEVADTRSIFVEAYFRRSFLNQIAIGDQARIYLVNGTRFVKGKVVDIQVHEHSFRESKAVNTVEFDGSMLSVRLEVKEGALGPGDIGQLAKVLTSKGQSDWLSKAHMTASLLLRSHDYQ